MKIFTIGFTQSSAEHFFARLKNSGAKRILDVRLNNRSQLAGFAKRDDLKYFVRTLCGMDYEHCTDLAPTREMFEQYKLKNGCWDTYAADFLNLITQRQIEHLDKKQFTDACLLCSEHKPHHCHRRLVAEYLAAKWSDVSIIHL
ncbi:DUF488 domain-containing protein [Citrobacter sp. CK198]|uniref:DUF488 domain-containing protein n=1 Tax=Citrobacter sp. CK198 TaxID=2985107 RepID=UPI00257703B5|nr:DUF488 domain-containing protein [Citrobacter sp. CK198]MDM2974079.1 DUF488 domain-containing protein [Citrobacter sp. CK198]